MQNKSNFYPHQDGGNLNSIGVGNLASGGNLGQQQSIIPQPIVKTGRPIVNTGNLATNNLQHQVNMKKTYFCIRMKFFFNFEITFYDFLLIKQQKRIERAQTIANIREINGMNEPSITNTFHMSQYVRGTSYNGTMSSKGENEETPSSQQQDSMLNDFRSALRIISSDNANASKQHRNGDSGKKQNNNN